MGVKRPVDTDFWTDGKVDDFSPEDKYFMLYLLTSPFSRQLGIYEISVKQAAFQMGYSVDAFNVLLERFETKYNMIVYSKETSEVAILNFLRRSVMKGGKPVEDCILQDMAKVKNKKLIDLVFLYLRNRTDWDDINATVRKIVTTYLNENDIHNDNDNDNDRTGNESSTIRPRIDGKAFAEVQSEQEKLKESYQSIVGYLNEKAGTHYKATTEKTKSAIRARLAEGFTVDDFKTVIDKKCAEWIGDPKMEQYLRPETLFGTKFESYLNAKVTKERNGSNGRDSKGSDKPRVGNYI